MTFLVILSCYLSAQTVCIKDVYTKRAGFTEIHLGTLGQDPLWTNEQGKKVQSCSVKYLVPIDSIQNTREKTAFSVPHPNYFGDECLQVRTVIDDRAGIIADARKSKKKDVMLILRVIGITHEWILARQIN
jgi:hypothetical protein